MSPPPPRASPEVPRDDDDAGTEPTTGLFPATREYARHIGYLSVLKAAGLVVVGIAVAAVLGWERLGTMAEKRADEKVAVFVATFTARIDSAERRITTIELGQLQLGGSVYELQKDVRELYRVGRDGRRSERLEQPPPLPFSPIARDGGL